MSSERLSADRGMQLFISLQSFLGMTAAITARQIETQWCINYLKTSSSQSDQQHGQSDFDSSLRDTMHEHLKSAGQTIGVLMENFGIFPVATINGQTRRIDQLGFSVKESSYLGREINYGTTTEFPFSDRDMRPVFRTPMPIPFGIFLTYPAPHHLEVPSATLEGAAVLLRNN